MRVQRFSEHRAMPWANGKGTSYEVVSDRDTSDHWSWRVAIAPVVQDGTFSSLAGVDRELVVIEGNGMVLDILATWFSAMFSYLTGNQYSRMQLDIATCLKLTTRFLM